MFFAVGYNVASGQIGAMLIASTVASPVTLTESRSSSGTPVLMSPNKRFDASSEVYLRSSLSPIHDAVLAAPFNHDVAE